jgi:hypothetical protein
VARAKRTDRAEARRKYRAYLLAQEQAAAAEAEGSDEAEDVAGSKPSRSRVDRPQPTPQPGVRMGIMQAARAAYHSPTYIADLKYLPTLVGRTHAVWPVLAICVVSGVYAAAKLQSGDYRDDWILPMIFQFVFYPPLIPAGLAGFFAPRATWLAGVIAAFLCSTTFVLAIGVSGVKFTDAAGLASPSPVASASQVANASATLASTAVETSTPAPSVTPEATPSPGASAASASAATPAPSSTPGASGTPAPSPTSNGTASGSTGGTALSELMTYTWRLLLQTLPIGALMGALSGWYKRFLALSSGPHKPPPSRGASGRKPQQRRSAARR